MKRIWVRKPSYRAAIGVVGLGAVIALVAMASAQANREGASARDKARNADAGDPNGVTSSVSPVIGVEDPPGESITPDVGKSLLAEFQHAQAAELKALDHRNKLELKELKASQSARQKEWEKHEREARHKYFSEHTRGPDRRAYIKDFMERRRSFLQLLTDEAKQRVQEQDVRVTALREDQSERLKEFKASLARNQRPPARLWPGAG